jgi:type I restriction enzyme M protein
MTDQANNSAANLGFERELWLAADALRSNMDAAEYKHVVLGLIFLKYISDAFEEYHAGLETERAEGADPEDPDEYRAVNIFWVPPEARWSHLLANAKQPTIGKVVDDAMLAIERDNPTLKGVLPKDYVHPRLDKQRLGQLIDLVGNIGLGDEANRSRDILGRVYEYFLSQFASAEGKKGGQFYTPHCVVRLLVAMLAPYKGRVFDPCCGSGGMFVQSVEFVRAHATGNNSNGARAKADISVFGQESNHTTWRLAKMNLAIRGIDGNLGQEHADSFHRDLHPDLKADYVLANPPFNDSDWRGELLKQDKRWKYGTPPASNANFAWVQHFIHHLAPTGLAGFVLANGSMSSNQSGEGEIRKNIIEADLVDCMVALPGQLFYSTPIPVCLWFIARDKRNGRFRDRRGETLFIDARDLGAMIDRTHRELTDEDIRRIGDTYHAWRGDKGHQQQYGNVTGFCYSATVNDIVRAGYDLNPGRYAGSVDSGLTQGDLARQLERQAGETFNICNPVVEHSGDVLAVVSEVLPVLQDFMDGVTENAFTGILKDIVVVSRNVVNPSESPDSMFDLYSIPAFDYTGLPERVLGETILSGKLVIDGDAILVSKLNPRKPRVWAVRPTSPMCICSTEFAVLRPKDARYFEYLYLFCISQRFQKHLIAHATGSTGSRQRVKIPDLLAAPLMIPSPSDAELLGELFKPILLRVQSIPQELMSLSKLAGCMSEYVVANFDDAT